MAHINSKRANDKQSVSSAEQVDDDLPSGAISDNAEMLVLQKTFDPLTSYCRVCEKDFNTPQSPGSTKPSNILSVSVYARSETNMA